MRRNPIYVFKDTTSQGIYEVPVESMIQIIDSDGVGTPLFTQITNKNGLSSGSTIADFLNIANSHIDLDRDTLSELEKVGNGWRLLGKNPANYATLGTNAVDLSDSQTVGEYGAKGVASFAVGTGTKAINMNSTALGSFNKGTSNETIVEVGSGIAGIPKNALEIFSNGTVSIPEATDAKINSRGAKALTTREYVENRVASEFPSRTTDDLTEGTANLYYTDTRATTNFTTNIAIAGIDALSDVDTTTVSPITGQTLKYDGTNWTPANDLHEVTSVNALIGDVILTTADVAEGGAADRRYYTEARFDASLSSKTTDNLGEGVVNFYYTDGKGQAAADIRIAASPLSTLSDVDATPATNGQVLTSNGTSWVPNTLDIGVTSINLVTNDPITGAATVNLSDIADVNVAGATVGQILAWDDIALEWSAVNQTDTVTTVTDGLTSTSTIDALSANQGRLLDTTKENIIANPAIDGDVLASTVAGVRSWITPVPSLNPVFTGTVNAVDVIAGGTLDVTGDTSVVNLNVTGTLTSLVAATGVDGLMPGTAVDALALLTAGTTVADIATGANDVATNEAKINELLSSLRTAGIIS